MGPSHTVDAALAHGGGVEGGEAVCGGERECAHSWFSVCVNHTANEQTPDQNPC